MSEAKNHVEQVAAELEKLGFAKEEAHQLCLEKHRPLVDHVVTNGMSPGEAAETIMERETQTESGKPAATPPVVGGNLSALDQFEASIPKQDEDDSTA